MMKNFLTGRIISKDEPFMPAVFVDSVSLGTIICVVGAKQLSQVVSDKRKDNIDRGIKDASIVTDYWQLPYSQDVLLALSSSVDDIKF